MDIQPIKISSKVINSNQFIHSTNQFIQDMGPLAFEGQFDLTEYLRQFIQQYEQQSPNVKFLSVATPATVTGTLSETILLSVLIPANTITQGTVINTKFRAQRSVAPGSAGIRFCVSDTNSLVAPIDIVSLGVSGIKYIQVERTLHVINQTTDTQVVTSITGGTDSILSGATLSSLTIDWTTDKYFILSGTLSNIAESIEGLFINIQYLKP